MTGRERVVIVAMALSVVYGGYRFAVPKAKDGKMALAEKNRGGESFVDEIKGKLNKLGISSEDACVIARGSAKWPANPFFHGNLQMEEKKEVETDPSLLDAAGKGLKFSGYIQTGDRILAIINGMEYETGEMLSQDGYFVKSITPNRVVVARTDGPGDITLALDSVDTEPVQVQGQQ